MELSIYCSLTLAIALISITMVPAAVLPVTSPPTSAPTSAGQALSQHTTRTIYIPIRDKDTLLEKVIENVKIDEDLMKKKREELQNTMRTVKGDQRAIEKDLNDVNNILKSLKEQRELAQKALKMAKKSSGIA